MKENMPIVPETPIDIEVIISEIKMLDAKHNYLGMLSAIRVAVDHEEEKNSKRRGYYILILNYSKRNLRMKFYKPSQIDDATKEYNQIESSRDNNKIDAVLVSVSSFGTLKAAYPNYFSDINAFLTAVNEIIKK